MRELWRLYVETALALDSGPAWTDFLTRAAKEVVAVLENDMVSCLFLAFEKRVNSSKRAFAGMGTTFPAIGMGECGWGD